MALRDDCIVDVNPRSCADRVLREGARQGLRAGGTVEPDATILARHRRARRPAAVVETVRCAGRAPRSTSSCAASRSSTRAARTCCTWRACHDRKPRRGSAATKAVPFHLQCRSGLDGAARCRVPRGHQYGIPCGDRMHARKCSAATACSATTPPSSTGSSRHAGVLAGELMVVETQRTREDGRRIDLELRGVPVQYCGKPHVLYIGRDISERKRTEEALRVSEEQYRSIFNASQDTMVLRDADFRIVDVNGMGRGDRVLARASARPGARARRRPARVRAVPAGSAPQGARRRDR